MEWQQVKEKLLIAASSTGDDASKAPAEVAELLSFLREADAEGFLEQQPIELLSTEIEASEPLAPTASHHRTDGRFDRQIGNQIDRYEIIRRLGRGAFGETYLARDPQLDLQVAIKVPRPGTDYEGFLEEARAASAVRHPNIVAFLNVGIHEDIPFAVMEYLDGGTLSERMKRENMSWREAVEIAAALADGLARGNEKLAHCDLKPANIIFTRDGVPKIADFGLAVRFEAEDGRRESRGGTRPYMSPEQVRGDAIDGRSDIWALGVILYELLAGRRPFQGDERAVVNQILSGTPPQPVRQVNGQVPLHINDICMRCLKPDPDDRYVAARDLADDLRHALSEAEESGARTATPSPKPPITAKRWRGLAVTTLLLGVSTVAVVYLVASLIPQRDVELPEEPWTDPSVLVWQPTNDRVESYGFNAATREFEFETTAGPALFEVGKIRDDSLRISALVKIHGRRQPGNVGFFWGFAPVSERSDIEKGEVTYRCWSLSLGRFSSSRPIEMHVQQLGIGPNGGRHTVLVHYPVYLHPRNYDAAALDEVKIELDLTPTQVTQISVNGKRQLDHPIELEAPIFVAPWSEFVSSTYGIFGDSGSFSVSDFSATSANERSPN